MTSSCYQAYMKTKPQTRRMFNQAFFKRMYVKNKKVERAEFTELFDFLLNSSSDKNNLVDLIGHNSNQLVNILQQLERFIKKSK